MKTRTLSISVAAVLGIFNGCVTSSSNPSGPASSAPVTMQTTLEMRPSDRMFYWREEARELHEMANHREREADLLLKKKPGTATNEVVKHIRSLVQQLHTAAEYAAVQAQEAEREMPHRMIQ